MENTSYSESVIKEWYNGFISDCPSGKLSQPAFIKIYAKFFPSGNATEFCEHIFRTFDSDKNGYIDLNEMTQIVKSIYHLIGRQQIDSLVAEETPEARAETIFKIMDLNSDGRITRNEFVQVCSNDQNLLNLLSPNLRL